ncbi:MAG: hypothetical protein SFU25_07700 [Candidatus Caenarcaniphilales bacterium]|nr:hypothetical protein [Candidatus Caenarcaniphilales bacterium]
MKKIALQLKTKQFLNFIDCWSDVYKDLSLWKKFLFFSWMLPNNLFAFVFASIVIGFIRDQENSSFTRFKDCLLVSISKDSLFWRNRSVCLGSIIISPKDSSQEILLHEYGHSLQSQRLGPLYFLIIGLPSLIRATRYSCFPSCFSRYSFGHCKTDSKYSYFHCFVEAWADHLGGVYARHEHKFKDYREYFWRELF